MRTRFGQDFEVEVQARFEAEVWPVFLLMFCRCYEVESWVEILKLGLVKILNFKFIGYANAWVRS